MQKPKKKGPNIEARLEDIDAPSSDLEVYAQEVLKRLIGEGIPPTPSNFDAYFDKFLDNKPPQFRKKIYKLLELEDGGDDDHQGILESRLKKAYEYIRRFMQHINMLYKNLRHLEVTLEKRMLEVEAIQGKEEIHRFLETVRYDIRKMSDLIKKDAGEIKETFGATTEIVKEIQAHTIYDEKFGVFKKNYLLSKMRQEQKLLKEFHHESTLMLVRPKKEVLAHVTSAKIGQMIMRTVARLLLKTSRRSDTVAHYGNGVFAIMMRHTSLQNAQKAAERLKELVTNTNFFVGDTEITIDVAISIARIDPERSIEESIVCALETLEKAEESEEAGVVCPKDIEL